MGYGVLLAKSLRYLVVLVCMFYVGLSGGRGSFLLSFTSYSLNLVVVVIPCWWA
ncbi:hypothetical protein SAMN02745225_01803 [Ferrithrix thermotolerans DSM 19514]|uniref:Uncharacterized protein n=1 Tax=Ferrithrix thermotolerans DSM 19514 TaxID=1121881 RepID=A0A1M4WVV8_9ACTN|nr:hypothetical protein SAMN02745225_01803 [Ferrithrix thermotolerans DSM 19514]